MIQKTLFFIFSVLPYGGIIFAHKIDNSDITQTIYSIPTSTFEDKQILNLLFEGDYNSELERISWKPYPTERIQTSLNNKSHTNIDSILYYQIDSTKYALVVLRTIVMNNSDEYEMLAMSYPVSVGLAQFTETDKNCVLQSFNRSLIMLSQTGMIPPYNILNVSASSKAFSLKEWEHQDGEIFEYLYSLNSYSFSDEIFFYPHFMRFDMDDDDEITYQLSLMSINSENSDSLGYYLLIPAILTT